MTLKLTKDGIALLFAERYAGHLRYLEKSTARVADRWLVRDGDEWVPENTLMVLDRVRELCREVAAECDDPALARAICSAMNISAVERLARTDRRLAATKEMVGLVGQPRAARRGRRKAEGQS